VDCPEQNVVIDKRLSRTTEEQHVSMCNSLS
jgi:hypothetical protein